MVTFLPYTVPTNPYLFSNYCPGCVLIRHAPTIINGRIVDKAFQSLQHSTPQGFRCVSEKDFGLRFEFLCLHFHPTTQILRMYIIICVDIEMTDALGFLPSHCFPVPMEAFTCSLICYFLIILFGVWGL